MAKVSSLCDDEDDELREACGVFGCVSSDEWPTQLDVAHIICLGLVALQHRGQESAGIVTSQGLNVKKMSSHKGSGLVSTIFNDEILSKLKGNLGIGHTRYSTAGGTDVVNAQPFIIHTIHGLLALGHNGELTNAQMLRKSVLQKGVGLSTNTDSELITQLLSLPPPEGEVEGPDWAARIQGFMREAPMAYSLVLLHGNKIFGVRDPYGNRPLCLGKLMLPGGPANKPLNEPDGWVISSESCAFQSIGAKYFREVEPGEIVELSRTGVRTLQIVPRPNSDPPAMCIFEYVYFARADSILEGQMVYSVRHRCGIQLAIESPVEADLVSTVPESATPAAIGYAQKTGLPFLEVLCKNRYVGRTFIQPSTRLRQLGVGKKFGPLSENFAGKRVVLVDDSIVRGNTIGPIIKLIKDAGAKEVHVRIASPPLISPCRMGINIPTKDELIANKLDSKELAAVIGANSLMYLTVEGLHAAVRQGIKNDKDREVGHCTACLTGMYPVALEW